MCTVLRTFRFVGKSRAVFLLQECADRSHVVVRMEGDVARGEACQLLLTAAEWHRLCGLQPYRGWEPGPDAVWLEMHFIDEHDSGDSLTVAGLPDREHVHVEMWGGGPSGANYALAIDLSREQWAYLTHLDIVDEPANGARRASYHLPFRVLPFLNRGVHR